MDYLVTAFFVRVREQRGQTMSEYALIMAAIAVVAFAAYTTLGGNIVTLVTNVANDL